jgi:hypothetical protein
LIPKPECLSGTLEAKAFLLSAAVFGNVTRYLGETAEFAGIIEQSCHSHSGPEPLAVRAIPPLNMQPM